jgi:hypothetical protein
MLIKFMCIQYVLLVLYTIQYIYCTKYTVSVSTAVLETRSSQCQEPNKISICVLSLVDIGHVIHCETPTVDESYHSVRRSFQLDHDSITQAFLTRTVRMYVRTVVVVLREEIALWHTPFLPRGSSRLDDSVEVTVDWVSHEQDSAPARIFDVAHSWSVIRTVFAQKYTGSQFFCEAIDWHKKHQK